MTAKSVKFMHSGMNGAPSISGTAGHMIALLDALLVNGFGSGQVDSVSVAGGVATVTRSAGHPFEVGAVALIAGVTGAQTGLNGEHEITEITTTTYKYLCPGVPDGSASGTITHKVAPLNFTKQFSGTNLAAYKSSDVASTGCLLRVDDTSAQVARVVGYETMSDINTGTGPFPTSAQVSGGAYWPKSNTSDAATRQWMLVGDSRCFHLIVSWSSAYSTYGLCSSFGDISSYKSPDTYGCMLFGHTSNQVSGQPGAGSIDLAYSHSSAFNQCFVLARSYTGIGGSVNALRAAAMAVTQNNGIASGSQGWNYPNFADGGLYVAPLLISEGGAYAVLRGAIPGLMFVPQTVGATVFAARDTVTGITGMAGRRLRAVPQASGVTFLDTTGPWR